MGIYRIEWTREADREGLLQLYRRVAAVEGGLARSAEEIDADYVGSFLTRALATGVSLVARPAESEAPIGEIHACALGPRVFAHVLGDLTIAVDPAWQGQGVGGALFRRLLEHVERQRPDILRVELIARESNARALSFYEQLGFRREGRMADRIRSVGGGLEADIPMAWRRAGG